MITVGLPVYNAMPYLRETMDSLRSQEDADFSILAIDDGSTDDSLAYLRSLGDRRLRILTQPNRGLSATLNRLLEETKTPWLIRQDADDISFPERIGTIRAAIAQYPEAGMMYSRACHYQNCKRWGALRSTEGQPHELRAIALEGYLFAVSHTSVALNVQKTRAIGGYRLSLPVEDLDLWWRLALAHEVRFLPEVLVGYRLNGTSTCSRSADTFAQSLLYAQYLLLSHLWAKRPLPLEEVAPVLSKLMDSGWFRFRQEMRECLIHAGRGQTSLALFHAVKAAWASPTAAVRRLFYPLRREAGRVRLGIKPALFTRFSSELWAEEANLTSPFGTNSQPLFQFEKAR